MALYVAAPALAEEASHHAKGGVNLGARIGTDTGEGFVDFIVPFHADNDSILFFNPRASLKDEGETELNLGLVARKKLPNTDIILGANAYLDRRESRHGNTFNQTGLGIEALSKWVDARLNYYHPNDDAEMISEAQMTEVDVDVDTSTSVSRDTDTSLLGSSTSGGGVTRFEGNNLVSGGGVTEKKFLNTTQTTTTVTRRITTTTTDRFFEQFEEGREGWDAELMFRLPLPDSFPQTRLGAGYYDYSSGFRGGRGLSGAKGRLEMRAGPFITLDAEVFEDKVLNGTSFFLGARLHLPFDMGRLIEGKNPFADVRNQIRRHNQAPFNARLDEMVMRDVRIQMEESEFLENERRKRQKVDVEVETSSSTRTEESVSTEKSTASDVTITEGGDPVRVVHVDDDNTGDPEDDDTAGAGTYENPHETAASTNTDSDSDIILVHAGSTVTDAAIEADNDDRVLGEGDGAVHIVNADQGVIELPETAPGSKSDPRPSIAGVSISSQDVEVNNFTVNSGSISTAAGSTHTNITVRRINSAGNSSDSVISLGAGGTLAGNIALNDIDITDHGGTGSTISIENADGTALISADSINIDNGNNSNSGNNGLFIGGSLAGSTHNFTNLAIANTGNDGLAIDGAGGTFTFDGPDIDTPGDDGVDIVDSSGTFTFNNADIDTPGDDGINVDNSSGTFTFNSPVIASSGDDAIDVDGSSGSFTFNTADIDNAGDEGFDFDGNTGTIAVNGGTIDGADNGVGINDSTNVAIDGLGINATTGNGIDASYTSGSHALSIANTIVGDTAPPSGNAIEVDSTGNGTSLGLTVSGSTLRGQIDGLNVATDGASAGQVVAAINNNTFESTGSGLGVQVTGGGADSIIVSSLDNNTISANGTGGGMLFDRVTFDASGAALSGTQATATGTTEIGQDTANRVQGDGISFIDPTGDLSFTTLNVFNNGGTGVEVNTKGLGTTFNLDIVGGDINTTGGSALDLDPLTGNVNFASVTSADSSGHGVVLDEFDGALTIGTTTISNPTNNGVVVVNDGAGVGLLDFGDTDITALGAGTGVDLTQANGNITFNTLEITGSGTADSTGIDLTGYTNTGTVMMNDTSSIQNVQFGVDLTNAAMSGIFQFGDGEAVLDTPSIIDTGGVVGNEAIVVTGLDPNMGTYNFLDVDFANPLSNGSDTSNLAGPDVFWVDMVGDGDGSRADPGSVTGANAATTDAIVLVNSNGSTADLIDASDDGAQGVDDTLMLDANQVLVSFNANDTVDLSAFGLSGGAPINVLVTGIDTETEVQNKFAGLAPTLTTTVANNTVALADNADVVGVNLANGGSGHALSGSGLTGTVTVSSLDVSSTSAGDGVNLTGGDANYTFNNLAVGNTGGDGLEVNGTSGNFVFNGTTTVNTAGGDGVKLQSTGGDITVDDLDIDGMGGHGLSANGVNAVSLNDGTIDNTSGDGINSVNTNLTVDGITFGATTAVNGNGIEVDNNDTTARTVNLSNLTMGSDNDTNDVGGRGIFVNKPAGAGRLTINVSGTNEIHATGRALETQTPATANNLIVDVTGATTFETGSAGPAVAINGDSISGTENSTVVSAFSGVEVIGNGTGGGMLFDNVTFDSDIGNGIGTTAASADQVSFGTTQVGQSTAARVAGDGVSFLNPIGDADFTTLNVFNDGGTGLEVDTKGASTDFELTGGGSGTIDTSGGTALFLDPLAMNLAFGAVTSTNAGGAGVLVDAGDAVGGAGSNALTIGTLNVTGSAGLGIDIQNSTGTFTFGGTGGTTVDNSASVGGGVDIANTAGDTTTVNFNGGLDIDTSTGTGFSVNGAGGVATTVNVAATGGDESITTSNGQAVMIDTATLGITLDSVSSTGSAAEGIEIDNASGTFTAAGGSITTAAGDAFSVAGGNGALTYGGGITNTNNNAAAIANVSGGSVTLNGNIDDDASGIDIINNTGGTFTFAGGSKSLNTGANNAVQMSGNDSGVTVNFTNGGLDIDTTSGTGFNATGGGMVNVTGSGNTINTGTGSGVNIANTTIGGSGVRFQSVSVNGAPNGIVLDTTGTSGGFTVTGNGNGGTCTPTSPGCSGGRIQSTIGTDGAVAGNGVYLNNTGPVSLSFMRIDNHPNHAIFGDTVNGFSLIDSVVDGANGDNDSLDEGSLHFINLLGSGAITRSDISGGHEDNLRIVNDTGTLDRLVISNSAFHDNHADPDPNEPSFGNDGILLESRNAAVMNITVDNTSFSAHRGDHFDAAATDNSTLDVVFTNNTMSGGHPDSGGQSFILSNAQSSNVTFDVSDNTINDAVVTAFLFFQSASSTAGSSIVGIFTGNTIGTTGQAGSGSSQGSGVHFNANGNGTMTVLADSNTIRQWNNPHGLEVSAGDGSPTVNATVTNNVIKEPDPTSFALNGLHLNAGTTSAGTASVCLDVQGNDMVGAGLTGDDFRLRQRNNSTVNLPGYPGGPSDTAAVVAFVQGNNTGAPTGSAAVSGSGFTGTGAACVTP